MLRLKNLEPTFVWFRLNIKLVPYKSLFLDKKGEQEFTDYIVILLCSTLFCIKNITYPITPSNVDDSFLIKICAIMYLGD